MNQFQQLFPTYKLINTNQLPILKNSNFTKKLFKTDNKFFFFHKVQKMVLGAIIGNKWVIALYQKIP